MNETETLLPPSFLPHSLVPPFSSTINFNFSHSSPLPSSHISHSSLPFPPSSFDSSISPPPPSSSLHSSLISPPPQSSSLPSSPLSSPPSSSLPSSPTDQPSSSLLHSLPSLIPFSTSSSSLFSRLFFDCFRPSSPLTALDLNFLHNFHSHARKEFDRNDSLHIRTLKGLYWNLFGELGDEINLFSREEWKNVGFQNKDPSSDFRGGGYMALKNFLSFVEEEKELTKIMCIEQNEFFLAITSINVTMFLKNFFGVLKGIKNLTCTPSELKRFARWLRISDSSEKLHHLLLKDVFWSYLLRKKNNSQFGIMQFNEIFVAVQKVFEKILKMRNCQEFTTFVTIYQMRLDSLEVACRK